MSVFGIILVRNFPAFYSIQTEYGEVLLICPYSIQKRENAGKMRTRITPSTDSFHAVDDIENIKLLAKPEWNFIWTFTTIYGYLIVLCNFYDISYIRMQK